jgi:hypothetical protein
VSALDIQSAYDPSEQLALLQRQCRQRSVAIYRDQALYLQVLRDEVQTATRQALFSLLSEVDPARFSRLSAVERSRFPRCDSGPHQAVLRFTDGGATHPSRQPNA